MEWIAKTEVEVASKLSFRLNITGAIVSKLLWNLAIDKREALRLYKCKQ